MDLSLKINDSKLNIRVSILLKTPNGYVFEKDNKENFYFPVGGRIKINEDSKTAAIREIQEELNITVYDLNYISTFKNFFKHLGLKYHEINIIYYSELDKELDLPNGFYFIPEDEVEHYLIQPQKLVDLISDKKQELHHVIIQEI